MTSTNQSVTREIQIARSHLLRAAEYASNEGNEGLVNELINKIELLNGVIAKSNNNGSAGGKQLVVSIPDAP